MDSPTDFRLAVAAAEVAQRDLVTFIVVEVADGDIREQCTVAMGRATQWIDELPTRQQLAQEHGGLRKVPGENCEVRDVVSVQLTAAQLPGAATIGDVELNVCLRIAVVAKFGAVQRQPGRSIEHEDLQFSRADRRATAATSTVRLEESANVNVAGAIAALTPRFGPYAGEPPTSVFKVVTSCTFAGSGSTVHAARAPFSTTRNKSLPLPLRPL